MLQKLLTMTTVTSSLCVWLVVVLVVSMTTPVEGFPSGAPAYTCRRMRPSHPFDAMVYSPHTFPYHIDLFADSAVPMAGDIITGRGLFVCLSVHSSLCLCLSLRFCRCVFLSVSASLCLSISLPRPSLSVSVSVSLSSPPRSLSPSLSLSLSL